MIEFANMFGDHPDAIQAWDFEKLYRGEQYVLDKYFVKGRVLDLGCGSGRTSVFLHVKGLQVEAVDIAEEQIRLAKQKYPNLSFQVMDATRLDFDEETFNYVLFSAQGLDTIHPLESRHKCLQEVFRVLKPDGIFAFTSHSTLCSKNGLSRTGYRREKLPYGEIPVYRTTPWRERSELSKNGFQLVEVYSDKSSIPLLSYTRDPFPMYIARKATMLGLNRRSILRC